MDTSDFGKIYTEYFSDVYKYVLSLCRNEAVADEVTQETFFKAMRHIDKFQGDCKLYVWLCQIAKSTYFSLAKKQRLFVTEEEIENHCSTVDIEGSFFDKETAKQLHILLHALKECSWLIKKQNTKYK